MTFSWAAPTTNPRGEIMTLEELQAKVKELSDSNEALAAKNRELLTEVKTFKAKAKGAEIDPAEHEQLKADLEAAQGTVKTLEKKLSTETEKLTKDIQTKDQALQKYLIDGGLSAELAKVGVSPKLVEAAHAYLRNKVGIKAKDDDFEVLMGDKPLTDAVKEWAASEQGKAFVLATGNSGGNAQGGNSNTNAKTVSRADWDAASHADRSQMAKDGFKVTE